MIKKFIKSINKKKKGEQAPKVKVEKETVQAINEFDLLVKNKRIIDCAKFNFKTADRLRIGIYQDTYDYIIANHSDDKAVENILNVLGCVEKAYQKLLLKHFRARNTADFLEVMPDIRFARYQILFKVHDLDLVKGLDEQVLCLSFLTRVGEDPYLVIGKKPKGKKDNKDSWEETKVQAKRKWIRMHVEKM